MMWTVGTTLRIIAWLVVIGSILAGVATIRRSPELAFIYAVGGVIGAALLYGIGMAFLFIEDMAIDMRRSAEANIRAADALEALANRRKQPPQP